MNYLTNYYKNLSEKLQEKVNLLESYINQLDEDLGSGMIVQPQSPSSSSTTTNQNENPGLNALLSAWGPVDPNSPNAQFDYNGDGFIDGDDLGVFLANNMSGNRPTTPQLAPTTRPGGQPTSPGFGKVSAMDQAGVENVSGGGFQTGGPNRPGITPTTEEPGVIRTKTPYSGPGTVFQTGGPNRPGITPNEVGGPVVRTKTPSYSPGVNTGNRQNPPTPPRTPKKPFAPTQTTIQSEMGELNSLSPTQGMPAMGEVGQEEIPYWMSQRTTQTDAGFRAMQRKRKD